MSTPHLTPKKLLGKVALPKNWQAAKAAFVCFTPFPNGFKPYEVEKATERYFLHSPNSEVRLCQFEETSFLVISEVYGFAVGATTVEELVYHGIDTIIGIGYVGAFNGAPLGQSIIARDTLSDLPIAQHYGVDAFEVAHPTSGIYQHLISRIAHIENWGQYRVWNSNSLYRESTVLVQQAKDSGCDVVNMDTLSIYAVGTKCKQESTQNLEFIYVGTVTDSANQDETNWESDLIDAVQRASQHPHDDLVKFMVEDVLINK